MKRNLLLILSLVVVAIIIVSIFTVLYLNGNKSGNKPTVDIRYYGVNVGPNGNIGFVQVPTVDAATNQTVKVITYYTWNITITHLNPATPPGDFDQALEPLVAKYPDLFTTYIPNTTGEGVTKNVTVQWTCYSYNGNNAESGLTLCAKNELSNQQITQLTQDLKSELPAVILKYYS